jgi:hypothetical protein
MANIWGSVHEIASKEEVASTGVTDQVFTPNLHHTMAIAA